MRHYGKNEATEIITEYIEENTLTPDWDTLRDAGKNAGYWFVELTNGKMLYLYDDPEIWIEVK